MAQNKIDFTEKIFACQRCGHCCHGETTVSLDEKDLRRMVDYLDMDVEEVKSKYLRITGNVVQMKTVVGHCIFYDDGCTVHPGRPWRCRQWPLHPSIISDHANFSAITSSCPGLKADVGYEKFCKILKSLMDEST